MKRMDKRKRKEKVRRRGREEEKKKSIRGEVTRILASDVGVASRSAFTSAMWLEGQWGEEQAQGQQRVDAVRSRL